jgi:tRNA(Ile2) C34 agmatinyltransferase TiaS
MSFKLIKDPEATVFRNFTIVSQAYTIGDLVDISRTAADVVPSTASSVGYGIRGVAMQTVTSAATVLLVALCTSRQDWIVNATNATNVAHNGQRMLLTDKVSVNNTGTDSTSASAVFEQLGVIDSTHLLGRLLAVANLTA